jgi:hypothetical protein
MVMVMVIVIDRIDPDSSVSSQKATQQMLSHNFLTILSRIWPFDERRRRLRKNS